MFAFIMAEPLVFAVAMMTSLTMGFFLSETTEGNRSTSVLMFFNVVIATMVAAYLATNPGTRLEGVLSYGSVWELAARATFALLMHPAYIVLLLVGLYFGTREGGIGPKVLYPTTAAIAIMITTFAYSWSMAESLAIGG